MKTGTAYISEGTCAFPNQPCAQSQRACSGFAPAILSNRELKRIYAFFLRLTANIDRAQVRETDLGDPYRVLVTLLEKNGDLPEWARLWPATSAMPQVVAAAAY